MTHAAHRLNRAAYSLVVLSILTGPAVHASPEGGDVVEGDATIDYGDWTRVVTGEITIIEWLSFNIAAGETVEFIMPSEASRVLNLINSGTPTEIMGNLIGNGQIFLVNPSGVIFGQGAVVDVGALYAAAGNINNTDFVNGIYRFTDARGVVDNRGLLQGDLIALVGGRVANHGTISAPGGTVVMAAGEQVLIGEHLGHVFVQLERPTDLENSDLLGDSSGEGLDLAAGDVFSLAAWNTGTIEADQTTIGVSAGHMAIDHSMLAGELTLIADGQSHIQLGADLHSDRIGVFLEGDVILNDNVQVSTEGGTIAFKGRVNSSSGDQHDLFVDAGGGTVRFSEAVGANDGGRLGILDVQAGLVRLYDDVSVADQMNFYAPVSISGDSTIFDVGLGSALFADRLYSSIDGRSDVSFLYDGQAWVGQGVARTPYQFRAGVGVGESGTNSTASGAFANIVFGGDLTSPSRASAFLFGTGARAGLELMHADETDLNALFSVNARESIVMGQGQKMVSFGSLSLHAGGEGQTMIEVGDLNVLGDLHIVSDGQNGGFVRFNGRAPGEIDWTGNEEDRNLPGLSDEGLELIASGDIVIDGELLFDGPVLLGGSTVSILNNSGTGDAGGLEIGQFPGGVSVDLFAGMLSGSQGLLYPYDLTLPASGSDDDSLANLATALDEDPGVRLRVDPPLLASRLILEELGLRIIDPSDREIRASLGENSTRYLDGGLGQGADAQAFGVTIDRLTPTSVQRLARANLDLLGDRVPQSQGSSGVMRVNEQDVQQAMVDLWLQTNRAYIDLESYLGQSPHIEPDTRRILLGVQSVIDAIDLLELTPREIRHAKLAFLTRILPETFSADEFANRWFRSPDTTSSKSMVVNR